MTAVARAKIIAQEAIDHVQAVHSLTVISWNKCGRQNGGNQSTFDTSREYHAISTPSDTSKSGFDCYSLLYCQVDSEIKPCPAGNLSNYEYEKGEIKESQICAYSCCSQRHLKTLNVQFLLKQNQ